MKSWISENGGMLAVLAVVAVVLGAFADWRIGVKVDEALAKVSFPSDATIEQIHGKNDAQDARMDGLGDRQDFTEEQLRDMAQILMRRPSE